MESAFAWLGQIVQWFGQFFPRWMLLDSTDGAVKFEGFLLPARWRNFKDPIRITVCGPGIHFWWPATTSFQIYPTAFQTDNLPSQTMETTDGEKIVVGGMLTYTIEDLGLLLPHTHSAMKMVQALTLAAIHDVCSSMTWEQLALEHRKRTLNTKLRNQAQKALKEFGVRVEDCMLTDLVRTRVYRLIQSTQQDDM